MPRKITKEIVPVARDVWSPDQVQLIKNTVARGATDNELKLFLYTAKRTGLDPLTRQVHFVKRNTYNKVTRRYEEVGTIQTGIDGYRAIAERTGTLAGNDDPIFEEGVGGNRPIKASVTIWRIVGGQKISFTASARWTEYAPINDKGEITSPMWRKMPYLMLGKCAEALALRKAFPNDLSGLYTAEEMAQADNPSVPLPAKPSLEITPQDEPTAIPEDTPPQNAKSSESEVVEIDGLGTLPPWRADATMSPDDKILECVECAAVITKAEHDYSIKFYARPLCRLHQKEAKKT